MEDMYFLVNILNMEYTLGKKKLFRIRNFSSLNPLNRLIQIYFPPEVRSAKSLKNKNISIVLRNLQINPTSL